VTRPIVVVGCGIIGLCVAYSLRQRGADVVVLDAAEPGAGASSGNAGWITPSMSGPLPMPGLARTSLRWMVSSSSPLYIRPRFDLEFFAWLFRFWRSCAVASYERGVRATAELNRETMNLYGAMRESGVAFESHSDGVIAVYRHELARTQDLHKFEELAPFGFKQPVVLDQPALAEAEPALADADLVGLLLPGEQYVRPDTLVSGLVRYLRDHGVPIVTAARVDRMAREGDVVTSIRASGVGEIIPEAVIVCAGAWTPAVMRLAGVSVPIQAGKGYHLDFAPAPVRLRHALNLAEDRVVVTPLNDLVRLTGVLEVSHADDRRISRRRIEAIAEGARRTVRGWPSGLAGAPAQAAAPARPDGHPRPEIGRAHV